MFSIFLSPPSRRVARNSSWGLGAEPPALGDFYDFSIKNNAFLGIFRFNFCFKTGSDNS